MDIWRKLTSKFSNSQNPVSQQSVTNKIQGAFSEKKSFSFTALPKNVNELKALPEAVMDDPFKTAALTVCALCAFAEDRAAGIEMLNFLRGPRPLSPYEISFMKDRFMDGKTYIPRSYFNGATPENDYTPAKPYTVKVDSNQYSSLENGNYMKLLINSGGADSPRSVTLRKTGSGIWYLWEQTLLVDVRTPKSQDPWA